MLKLINRLKRKKIWLITGVAGFIGSNTAYYLLKNNQIVLGIDNLKTSEMSNLKKLRKFKKHRITDQSGAPWDSWELHLEFPYPVDKIDTWGNYGVQQHGATTWHLISNPAWTYEQVNIEFQVEVNVACLWQ